VRLHVTGGSVTQADSREVARLTAQRVALFHQHRLFVRRLARRRGARDGDVDDIVQRVFLTAFAKIHAIRPGAERSFLFTLVESEVGHLRRSYRRRREVDPHGHAEVACSTPRPDEAAHWRRVMSGITRSMSVLPPELRAALVLFELDGLSCEEIGRLQHIPIGTAKSRLRRARSELRRAFAKSGVPGLGEHRR
jgi:RNA polymerase sigma-70 factor (ECF subfamily)